MKKNQKENELNKIKQIENDHKIRKFIKIRNKSN